MLPLFFQVVLKDSPTKAGARLAIPSLATPLGGLIAGVVMSRWGQLINLVRFGAITMTIGNGLVTSLAFYDSKWKYLVYIFPANLGQGIIYPAILFTTLASFEHSGKFSGVPFTNLVSNRSIRSCCFCIHRLPDSITGLRMGRSHNRLDYPKYTELQAPHCVGRNTEQRRGESSFISHIA